MISRLLVGTDGSDSAAQAVERAVGLADGLRAQLTVTSVYLPPDPSAGGPFGPTEIYPAREIAQGVLRDVKRRYPADTVETALEMGDPADTLCRMAEEQCTDLIVVGNRGMSGTRRFLLGSVPNKVTHHAPCSVLVVNTTGDAEPKAYGKIVVGTDGSETAGLALTMAAEIAAAAGASLLIIYAGDEARGKQILDQAAGAVGDVPTETRVIDDDPAEALVSTAQSEGAQAIVVGSKGMTGAARFLLGSVPNKISHQAPCDVLIVRTA
jgi:nucleotide-binding universal stress UspA family protein